MTRLLAVALQLCVAALGQVSLAGPTTENALSIGGGSALPGIHLVNHIKGAGTTSFTTGSINNAGATSLYCLVTSSSATPVVSDSSSNVWTGLTNASNNISFATTKLFYVTNATVSTLQNFTVTAASAAPSMECASFSGTATSLSFDQQNQTNNGSGTTIQTGSVTPGANLELLLAGVGLDATVSTLTIDSGFTVIDFVDFQGTFFGSALAYLVQGTAAAVNPTWTQGATTHNQAKIATFK